MLHRGELLDMTAGPQSERLQRVLGQLADDGPEAQAIRAGEIDAVVDYADSNVILFAAARQALEAAGKRGSAGSPVAPVAPIANSLLAALPRADRARLLPALEPASLKFGDLLHEPGSPIRYVYFPVDCVVCLLTLADGQRTVEVALVGHEGMVGIALALGVDVASVRAQVQVAGTAMRMPAARFQEEFRRSVPLQRDLYRYLHVKMTQARQTAACAASHGFEARLACWLLMTSDRSRAPQILLTHEYLASIFNVRRVTVTMAAAAMRSRKLITYDRGTIRILDRKGLEAASCSCYRKIETLHAT